MTSLRQGLRKIESVVRRRLGMDDHAKVFEAIYQNNAWINGSGPGSTVQATGPYRQFLSDFMRERGVKSVVDVGCGDWQSAHLIDWSGITYVGTDVSETAIALASQYAAPGRSFQLLNALASDLPPADLLISKDVLQHWSNADIVAFLPKLSNYRFALLTNGFPANKARFVNADIRAGKGRPVDLAAKPFELPGRYVFDWDGSEPKRVFLWERA